MSAPVLPGSRDPLQTAYDVLLLDLDGVVYVGPHAVPGAPEALAGARAAGARVGYVTNNASRPPSTVADHLVALGVEAAPHDVVTSAQAAAGLLRRRLPQGSAVLVVGGAGLREALRAEGLRAVEDLADGPAAVVQGFSPDLGWRDLARGAAAVRSGLPWVATNLDRTVPTPEGTAPGNGTLVDAVAEAVGRRPDEVAGKPWPALLERAADALGGGRVLFVGDRLDTDVEGAHVAGVDSLLVLTGVTRPQDLLVAPPQHRPTHVGRDLASLAHAHPPAVRDGGGWRCGRVTARVVEGALEVDGPEPGSDADVDLDALRAACAASWAAADAAGGSVSA